MSSVIIIKNRFNNKDYRISIVPVNKRVSVPSVYSKDKSLRDMAASHDYQHGSNLLRPMRFDHIIFEAAIFSKDKFFKPTFSIELDDGYSKKMTGEEFAVLIQTVVENEKIDDLISGDLDVYKKYGFFSVARDMWQLFFLSNMRIIFIFKNPRG